MLGLAVGLGVALVYLFKLEDVLARRALHFERNVRARDVGAGEVAGGEALDFLLTRVDLRRTCAGGEAGDEVVELSDLLFALLVLALNAAADFGLLQEPFRRTHRCR